MTHEAIVTQCLPSTLSADVRVLAASSKTFVLGDEGEGIGGASSSLESAADYHSAPCKARKHLCLRCVPPPTRSGRSGRRFAGGGSVRSVRSAEIGDRALQSFAHF